MKLWKHFRTKIGKYPFSKSWIQRKMVFTVVSGQKYVGLFSKSWSLLQILCIWPLKNLLLATPQFSCESDFRRNQKAFDRIFFCFSQFYLDITYSDPGSPTILAVIDIFKVFASVWHSGFFHKLIYKNINKMLATVQNHDYFCSYEELVMQPQLRWS